MPIAGHRVWDASRTPLPNANLADSAQKLAELEAESSKETKIQVSAVSQ